MESQHIHKCSCGEVLDKTSGEGEGWKKPYVCGKCGKIYLIKVKIEFEQIELIPKVEK